MKTIFFITIITALLSFQFAANAQNWLIAGNSNITTSRFLGTTNNQPLIIKTNKAERMRVLGNGNVGIGTATPVARLEVFNGNLQITNTTGSANLIINRANSVAGSSNQILFVDKGVNKWAFGGTNIGAAGENNLSFYNYNISSNALTILTSNNNVGIGTATPGTKLHVSNGSAGSITKFAAPSLIVENSTHSFINILAPDAAETGILFGKPGGGNTSGGIIYNNSDNQNGLQFRTNGNSTRMVLTDAGNLGIGTETPGNKLTVTDNRSKTAPALIQNFYDNTYADGLYIQAGKDVKDLGPGSWYVAFQKPNGDFIGTISQQSSGSVAYNITSDKRLKTNIRETKFGLAAVNKIEVKDYNFIGGKEDQTGFLAQQLYEVFPEAVAKGGDDPKTRPWMVDYGRITPLLVKAVQELSKMNDEKDAKIAALESRLDKIEAQLKSKSSSASLIGESLDQNFPNPFNKSTIIRYSIPQGSKGQINIYDQTGKLVKTLNANDSGQSELNGNGLTAGTYSYTLMVNGKVAGSKQMVVAK